MPGVSGTGVRRARIGRLRPIRSTSVADRLPDLFIVKGLAVDRAQQRHVGADEAASGMHFTRNADFAAQLAIRSTIRRDIGDVVWVVAWRALRARIQGFVARQARIVTKS